MTYYYVPFCPFQTSPRMNRMLVAAVEAGRIMMAYAGKSPAELQIEVKGDNTILTIVDGKAQDRIVEVLDESTTLTTPVSFLAEEKRRVPWNLDAERWVIIDPADGTKNLSTGSSMYATAVASARKEQNNRLVVEETVTLQPATGLLVVSTQDGTYSTNIIVGHENGPKWSTHKLDQMARTGVVALWGDIKHPEDGRVIASLMRTLGLAGFEVRMIGSCVSMNAGVATGQFDGAIIYSGQKIYAHPWDVASAHQVVRAGGVATTILGKPDPLNSDPHSLIAARDAQTHRELLTIVQNVRRQERASLIADRPLRKILEKPLKQPEAA